MDDFTIHNHGSIILVDAVTDAARTWVEEHVSQGDFQPDFPDQLIVEPRYLGDILDGMNEARLTFS